MMGNKNEIGLKAIIMKGTLSSILLVDIPYIAGNIGGL